MRKATKSSLCFLVVLNSFVIVFAVALGVVLIVGDVLWRTPLYFDMLEAKGVQEMYYIFSAMVAVVIVVAILALSSACVMKKKVLRAYIGCAISCCGSK